MLLKQAVPADPDCSSVLDFPYTLLPINVVLAKAMNINKYVLG